MYDIIYSITCHVNIPVLDDMLQNIYYYNSKISIAVILNTNIEIYKEVINLSKKYKTVFINDLPFNKKLHTYDLCEAHLSNVKYCSNHSIVAKYVVLLASNCLFHKYITLELIEKLIENRKKINIKSNENKEIWFEKIEKNKYLISRLQDQGIKQLYKRQHEGQIIEFNLIKELQNICEKYDFKNNINEQLCFEEILFASFYINRTNYTVPILCKVFWELKTITPSIHQIINTELPCVKRVIRNIDDQVRIWQREITNNYTL